MKKSARIFSVFSILGILPCIVSLQAAPVQKTMPMGKKPTPTASTSPSSLPFKPLKSGVLWDYWYTVTVNQNIRYAYYNDRVEVKDDRIHYQNRFSKQEEGYINEEQLGAFAMNNAELTPLFFNFHSTYRTAETKIDGNVKDGKLLTVKIRKGNTDLPLVNKGIPQKIIFSVFFPVSLAQKIPYLKTGQPGSFTSILEDNLEVGFASVPGTFRLETPDAFANTTKTSKVIVNYRDIQSIWYVEKTGAPIRIEMPAQKTLIERASEEDAQDFLEE